MWMAKRLKAIGPSSPRGLYPMPGPYFTGLAPESQSQDTKSDQGPNVM